MRVSAGFGSRCRHRGFACGRLTGLLILFASLTGFASLVASAPEPATTPLFEEVAGDNPSDDPVEEVYRRGRLDVGEELGSIHPFVFGQSLQSLGQKVEAGLWAELLTDRKFFRPPTAPGSPWTRLGSEIGWSLTYDVERPYAGVGSVKITVTHRAQDEAHGIAQVSVPLLADQEYAGHVILAGRGLVKAFLEWGDGVGDRDVIRIRLSQEHFGRYPIRFRPRKGTAAGVFSIGLESTGTIWIGAVSLMPADHLDGLRSDTIRLLEHLDTPVYRWPGGAGLYGYDWRDGIGPRDQRDPRGALTSNSVEPNDFGIEEFLGFCRRLGAEPVVVVDTDLGSPELAAALVQYCNGSERTIWGRRRVLNGHTAPYNVRWWALGSGLPKDGQAAEMPRDQRLIRHSEFAQAMRAMDDRIQLFAPGQPGLWTGQESTESAGTFDLLREPFHPDPIIQREVDPVPSMLRVIVRAQPGAVENSKALENRTARTAVDGWNLPSAADPGHTLDHGGPLVVAKGLHDILKNPRVIQMAHFAPGATQALGAIRATETNAVLSSEALPFALYRHQFGTEALRVEGELEPLNVIAALTADRSQVTIGVINPVDESIRLQLELVGGSISADAMRYQIALSNPTVSNDSDPEPIIEATVTGNFNPDSIQLPPFSVTLYRVPLRR